MASRLNAKGSRPSRDRSRLWTEALNAAKDISPLRRQYSTGPNQFSVERSKELQGNTSRCLINPSSGGVPCDVSLDSRHFPCNRPRQCRAPERQHRDGRVAPPAIGLELSPPQRTAILDAVQ